MRTPVNKTRALSDVLVDTSRPDNLELTTTRRRRRWTTMIYGQGYRHDKWPSRSQYSSPLLYTFAAYRKLRAILTQFTHFPGEFSLFGNSQICALLPDIRGFNRGLAREWNAKHDQQEMLNSDVYAFYNLLPIPRVTLVFTDATVAKEITTNRSAFPKPHRYYEIFQIYGPNILTTEGSDWKGHRKICAPAFSERNNALVHEETKNLLLELFDLWETTGQVSSDGIVEVQDMRAITTDLALQVILRAGFGYMVNWNDDGPPPAGHRMTFKSALRSTVHDLTWRIALPRSLLKLFSKGRRVITAYEEVEQYMIEMIRSKMDSSEYERSDLLTNLCKPVMDAAAEKGEELIIPNEAELMGNIFIFLLAGHETTARALSYTLAMLALHEDVQQKVLDEITSIVEPGQLLTYAHVQKLKYTEAVLYEVIRQYPPINNIPKRSEGDNVLTSIPTSDGFHQVVPVPDNTGLSLSICGMHYNPKYWPDPYKFDPERFMKTYNKDAFIAFSAGPRACIGRRFSEVEAITAVAIFVSKFHIRLKEGADIVTKDSKGRSLIKTNVELVTINPTKLPLVFKKR